MKPSTLKLKMSDFQQDSWLAKITNRYTDDLTYHLKDILKIDTDIEISKMLYKGDIVVIFRFTSSKAIVREFWYEGKIIMIAAMGGITTTDDINNPEFKINWAIRRMV